MKRPTLNKIPFAPMVDTIVNGSPKGKLITIAWVSRDE
jgi:hypothetical protein